MATVPVFPSLGDALTALAPGASLEARRSVGGGDINRAYRLTLSDGTELFSKANASSLLPMFEAEAEGLAALRATGTIGVTEVLGIGLEPEAFGQDASFLLLAWLEPGAKRADFWETFAEELAAMHAADTAFLFPERGGQTTYGFPIDNYIGSTPQINTPKDSWVDFFRECRLHPQVRMAYDAGYLERSAIRQADSIMERLETLLPEPDHPSLLHGDLWGGNYMTGPDGKAWLIDPATYVGHREADLAMTELFGGFSP
ncbi:MAG: fructosamine kinase family protein, partial [Clostridia bacterium]|nr:fructosamine kinase family protein [Clostridia bacterium]